MRRQSQFVVKFLNSKDHFLFRKISRYYSKNNYSKTLITDLNTTSALERTSYTRKLYIDIIKSNHSAIYKRSFTNLGPGPHKDDTSKPCECDDGDYRFENGEFGEYELVTVGNVSPRNLVPDHIKKPEYAETGHPKLIHSSQQPTELQSPNEIKKLRDACKLARFVLNSLIEQAKVGITTDQLDLFAHNLIIQHDAYPSPLNYKGFPKSICTSVNNVACHGIPDDRALVDGDIMNIDVTVFLNGFHGDNSETVCIGNVDTPGKKLVETTRECLHKGISICGPGVPFRNIGKEIEALALKRDLMVIPAFSGHGIGAYFHCPPDIYHIDFDYPGVMKPGMAFTIEPILSHGYETVEIQEDGWTAMSLDNARSAQFEHTILITSTGVEILT